MDKVKGFLDEVYVLSHSESTKLSYRTAVRNFQAFLRQNYGEDDQEIIQKIKENTIDTAQILKEFVIYLDTKKYKPASISMWLGAVKGYLRHCGIKIYSEDLKGIVRIPKQSRIKDIPITKDNIVQLLNVVPLQLKTVILVAIASGMRIGEIVQLQLSDIDLDSTPVEIHIRAQTTKTKNARTAYLTQEATSCLKRYLERFFGWIEGEKNVRLEDKLIFARISNNTKPQNHQISHLVSEHTLWRSLNEHIKKIPELNKKSENGRKVIHFHGFRKFFRTVVGEVIGRDFAEEMIGHGYYMDTYVTLEEKKKKEMYLKAEPYLTISDFKKVEENLHELSEKQSQLEKTVEDLKQYLTTNSVPVPILLQK